MKTRTAVRTAFILILTAYSLVINGVDLALPWHPFSTYGVSALPDGTITAVDTIDEKKGLHAGDVIDLKQLTPQQRFIIGAVTVPEPSDTTAGLTLPLTSGRTVTVQAHQYRRSLADNISDIIAVISLWVFITVAAALVLLRPIPATWAFFVFAFLLSGSGTLIQEFVPFSLAIIMAALSWAANAAGPVAWVSFALRFPNAEPRGPARTLEHALIFVVAPLTFIWLALGSVGHFQWGWPLGPWWAAVQTVLQFLLFGFGIIALLARYATADAASRNALRWIVATFAIALLPWLSLFVVQNTLGIFPEVTIVNVAQMFEVLAPVAVAYTVLRHRLFDIRFVVSRALVYALLTSITVGLLALVDWAFGRWLAESRFALVGELALAVFIGVMLTTVHRRIESFLNAIIFRAQAVSLNALRRFAMEIDLIADPHRLLSQVYDALRTRLESEYVGIYTVEGSAFTLATPHAGSLQPLLPADDFAVLRLRRWAEAFECDEPEHPMRAALFAPMMVRAQLAGFIVCGPKRDRTHYLPEEVETISTVAHRTGSAYGWLTMRNDSIVTAPTR